MHNDDEAWRGIVENFGARADLEESEVDSDPVDTAAESPYTWQSDLPVTPPARTWDESSIDSDWTQEGFVPPPPPPVPSTTTDRKLAWFGVFGSPAVLLLALVLGVGLPSFIATLLVVSFVGGFLYLVMQMPRGPRDPGDDGARL